ncbi:hypothetical protein POF51_31575 [Brevibacillus sp. AG]|uniref:hypothetical protein n=1 Tax=Brevibacillus sp. AG TaxID=3020891 RepID=UPI0023306F8C|nr:hypothetical protein [Brevibacillus sp. AG]MDC0765259.1 hypothetical protein [Brevibacillus sp. AG]
MDKMTNLVGKIETEDDLIDQEELELPEFDMEFDELNDEDNLAEPNDLDDEEVDRNESSEDIDSPDLSEFTPSVCEQTGRTVGQSGVMSVVNSKNGVRVALSKELIERLGHPKTIQIGFSDHLIAISENLGDRYTSYTMQKSGPKSIIYRSKLVKQITEKYRLDFSNRTSVTFTEVSYKSLGDKIVALISVK